MIIGVDVDNTVVDIGYQWFMYLLNRYEIREERLTPELPYNISEAFFIPEGCDPFAFWRDPSLYEGLTPIVGSVEALQALKEEGHQIFFISQMKGWHSKSKYYFLEKWFPFKDAVIMTKEKWAIRPDIMIDDNVIVLDSMPRTTKTFHYQTDYYLAGQQREHTLMDGWDGFKLEI